MRLLLVTAAACVLGCEVGPEVINLQARVGDEKIVVADEIPLTDEDFQVTWRLLSDDPDSGTELSVVDSQQVRFTPDRQGLYLLDRWMEIGASEDHLTQWRVRAVLPQPIASFSIPAEGQVGATISLNAFEIAGAQYEWRLTRRPAGSQTRIQGYRDPTASLLLDAPGRYELALALFDGMDWSAPEVAAIEAVDGQ